MISVMHRLGRTACGGTFALIRADASLPLDWDADLSHANGRPFTLADRWACDTCRRAPETRIHEAIRTPAVAGSTVEV